MKSRRKQRRGSRPVTAMDPQTGMFTSAAARAIHDQSARVTNTIRTKNYKMELVSGDDSGWDPEIVAVIESRSPIAKQCFFGWGSDRNRVDGSFYGSSVDSRGEETLWRWRLTQEGVDLMIRLIEEHVGDRDYYDRKEAPVARELLRLLQRVR